MSMRTLERAILNELKAITGRKNLRMKDVLEWSSSEDEVRKNAQEGEEVIECPSIGVWAAIAKKVARGDK